MSDKVRDALRQRRSVSGVDDNFSEMFGLPASSESDIIQVPIRKLRDYEDQPFRPYNEEALQELAGSIREHGLLNPISIRELKDGKYQILAGRNRKNACVLLGLETISAKLIKCDDDTAAMIMLSSNLNQRQKLLPSEKAFAYKMQMDILKRQGKRTDLDSLSTSNQLGWKSETANKVAETTGTSSSDIRRHIHLTFLLPELLTQVDKEVLPFMAGYNLSFLSSENQTVVLEWLKSNGFQISVKLSEKIKKYASDGTLSVDVLKEAFSPGTQTIKSAPIRISRDRFKDYEDVLPADNADFEEFFTQFLKWLRSNKN